MTLRGGGSMASRNQIVLREKVNPEEGSRKYGRVTFPDWVNTKYPIDTQCHARTASNDFKAKSGAAPDNPGRRCSRSLRGVIR